MPQYLVRGFDRESGQQIDRKVAADSEEQAVKLAGIVVELVQLAPEPIEDSLDLSDQHAGERYEGLTVASVLLRIAGAIGMVAGLVSCMAGLVQITNGEGLSILALGLPGLIGGALVFGVGEGLRALRDIAIAVTSKP